MKHTATPSPETKYAIGISAAAALVVAAAFMPWGEVTASPAIETPIGEVEFRALEMTVTITGWNGHLNFGAMRIPNWLVVVAAAGAVLLTWCRSLSVWNAPVLVPLLVAGYGLAHAVYVVVGLIVSDRGTVGIGSVLTALSFAAMLVLTGGQYRVPKAGETGRTDGTPHTLDKE